METIHISTNGNDDIINITEDVEKIVEKTEIKEGICLISSPGSTCGITTIEYEEGLINDLKEALERIAPKNSEYHHCRKWGDCNGYSHIRSTFIKPFLSVPIKDGKLLLGMWQQIVFIDFDKRPRSREINIVIVPTNL